MPITRVTQGLMAQRNLSNINYQLNKLMQLQNQLATGMKVSAPSDDPLAARRAINIRAVLARNEQYISNISSAGPQLTETTTTVQTMLDELLRARELATEGANGTYDSRQRANLAEEVNQILEDMVNLSNHQTNGRFIFAGSRTTAAPYTVTRNAANQITGVTYNGNDELTNIQIADGIQVAINEPGSTVFQGSQDVFQLMINLRDDLLNNQPANIQNVRLAELQTTQEQLLSALARVGGIQNRMESASSDDEDYSVRLQQTLSDNIDVDYAETMVSLNMQSNAFQAALNAGARTIQPSLMDYIG